MTPQTAILGLINNSENDKNRLLVNHILLLFKIYVYRSREKQFSIIQMNNLVSEIRKIKRFEKEIASYNTKKLKLYRKKWQITDSKIPIEHVREIDF